MLRTLKRLTGKKKQVATAQSPMPIGLAPETEDIFRRVHPYTMTSAERIEALCNAVDYVCSAGIAGDVAECGVWRGGSMMAAALRLLANNSNGRGLYLYDTFDGMSEPTEKDVDHTGNAAQDLMQQDSFDREDSRSIWCVSRLEEVRSNLASTGYPEDRMQFVKGRVEETIPRTIPDRISILRLDTDWYESTRHELEHLYPRLVDGGVLIIDDYGHWQGCRRAVDEYFENSAKPILLNRIDYTGRIAVKVA
ncbi:MAG: TylF/MycF/NovP-related O-methyltransferase [Planctomycetota bacterium]